MYRLRKQFYNKATKSLKIIAKHLGLDTGLRLANARHALANRLKRHNVDRETVKDLFGHTSIETMDNYY
jgi:site-specific recombinase XerD